ncbi:MAG TPA: TraR/DksA family transcriptional regulator [Rhizobacter sp.]|nr:TraR/DksA family transcriptional regulator [Rhizobacter sp.]
MDVPTQAHLHTLRELLLYRRRELMSEVHAADLSRQAAASSSGAEVTTHADGASQRALSDVDVAQDERDRSELAQVDAALARLDQGVYGDCSDCGEPIPLQRLMVQPAAARCAACQAAFEH